METVTITFENGKKKEYRKGIKLSEIIDDVQEEYEFEIIGGRFKNQDIFFDDSIIKSGNLYLYDINTKEGNKIYEKGLTLLFKVSALQVLGKDTKIHIRYSLDKGIFFEIDKKLAKQDMIDIKRIMLEKVEKALPFSKIETSRLEAIDYFKKLKQNDKAKTLFFNTDNYVTLYKFDGYYTYMLGSLPHDSSVLKYFDLTLLEDEGIVLRYPSIFDNGNVVKYTHHEKYFNNLKEYSNWGGVLNVNNIGELNEKIINATPGEIINLAEIIQTNRLYDIVEEISSKINKCQVILISGPSSSGKTTTARKLALYLKANGINPIPLSLDDYFYDREKTPLDENGKPDFESIRAIDIKLFNNQIEKITKGMKVTVPTFDFVEGKKVYHKTVQMNKGDVLIIEGLHALNDTLLPNIKNKYKIYVSPLQYLNIDNDNRINTTDIRLLRRIVRDNRLRGYNPSHTLNGWCEVRKGEEKYVFPYQDSADVIFNSFLVYELGVLKAYAVPLLFSVKEDDPEYQTAIRLIELLSFVLPISSDAVPALSILREFIGGSYFE